MKQEYFTFSLNACKHFVDAAATAKPSTADWTSHLTPCMWTQEFARSHNLHHWLDLGQWIWFYRPCCLGILVKKRCTKVHEWMEDWCDWGMSHEASWVTAEHSTASTLQWLGLNCLAKHQKRRRWTCSWCTCARIFTPVHGECVIGERLHWWSLQPWQSACIMKTRLSVCLTHRHERMQCGKSNCLTAWHGF